MSPKNRLTPSSANGIRGLCCDNWRTVAIVLRNEFDAKDAANEACLFLIWKRQGRPQPLLVIEGAPKLRVPGEGFSIQRSMTRHHFAEGKLFPVAILVERASSRSRPRLD